jgi:uracil-DNA glycosylase family 4
MALIMLVGEAPGEAEARTGQPFMGRSGQLLNKLLEMNGMSQGVYITNTCKCRPHNNRKPIPQERETCRNLYLYEEIRVLNPRVIVCLGKTAILAMIGRKNHVMHRAELPINVRSHQEINHVFGRYIIPTWHPAYCLRSGPGATQQLAEALALAKVKALNDFVDLRPQ